MPVICFYSLALFAQNSNDEKKIMLHVRFSDKDSSFHPEVFKDKISFNNKTEALLYVETLKRLFINVGYPTASIDSVALSDSTLEVVTYVGEKYDFIIRSSRNIDKQIFSSIGVNQENLYSVRFDYDQLQSLQKKILNYYENNGYPFASVYLDSIQIKQSHIDVMLNSDKGVYYTIDSIRIVGDVVVKKSFLQHYLNIKNKSPYNKDLLRNVDGKLLELTFVKAMQPSDITMLGSGAILNTYLKSKKSSQFFVLAGVQPSTVINQKTQLTADVNLDLKNLFGSGENIVFKWQQLQSKSPRLNLGYVQPYVFNSAIGTEMLFELFKKDSSFLQLNALFGFRYELSTKKLLKLNLQWRRFSLLEGSIDTTLIIVQKALPPNIDMSSTSVGLEYEWNTTDYRYNPRSGDQIIVNTQLGLKQLQKNNDIIQIKDPAFDYGSLYDSIKLHTYNFKMNISASHFFPAGKNATIKTSCNLGYLNSPEIFRNELFQIGGYKLMRGFDEESIYATSYGVFSAEYRLLLSLNSYLSFFSDFGTTNFKYQTVHVANNFIGAGIGLLFETKAGILNLSYAMGKRNDVPFNLRSASKIHFGYINYF